MNETAVPQTYYVMTLGSWFIFFSLVFIASIGVGAAAVAAADVLDFGSKYGRRAAFWGAILWILEFPDRAKEFARRRFIRAAIGPAYAGEEKDL